MRRGTPMPISPNERKKGTPASPVRAGSTTGKSAPSGLKGRTSGSSTTKKPRQRGM